MIDENTQRPIVLPKIAVVGIFFGSLLFFVYLTFPFGVLKESLTAAINRNSDFNVRIGYLSSDFPVGLRAEDVVISKRGAKKSVSIKKMSVELGLLSLLIGRVRVDAEISEGSGSYLDLSTSFSLFGLMSGAMIPNRIDLDAKNYAIGQLFEFAMSTLEFGPEYQQFIGSYLEKFKFQGKLNGLANISLDIQSPSSSQGSVSLSLIESSFTIDDPSLKIDSQIFSKFTIALKVEKGAISISDSTAILSQDLDIKGRGGINLKSDLMQSPLDVTIDYKLQGSIQKEVGSLIDMFSGGSGGGAGKVQMVGTLAQWQTKRL
jgi:type II secretion system protein N